MRKAKKTRLKLSRTIERLFNILIGSDSVRDGYIFERKRELREYLTEEKGGEDKAKRNGKTGRRNEANNPIESVQVRAWIGLHIKQVELSPLRRANEARFLH